MTFEDYIQDNYCDLVWRLFEEHDPDLQAILDEAFIKDEQLLHQVIEAGCKANDKLDQKLYDKLMSLVPDDRGLHD